MKPAVDTLHGEDGARVVVVLTLLGHGLSMVVCFQRITPFTRGPTMTEKYHLISSVT